MRYLLFSAFTFVAFSSIASSREVYLLQGGASGRAINDPGRATECELTLWATDVIFFNRGSSAATVRMLEISNGGPLDPTAQEVVIAPSRSASLERMLGSAWVPRTLAPLWMVKLDVPDELLIENTLFVGTDIFGACPVGIPPQAVFNRGRVSLPVFTSLIAAGEPQLHLATYMGRDAASRTNVAIYNASDENASATVELRQHCNEAVLETCTVTVPPKSVVQYTDVFTRRRDEGCPPIHAASRELGGPEGALYTVITVSQPSLTFVSNIVHGRPPLAGVGVW